MKEKLIAQLLYIGLVVLCYHQSNAQIANKIDITEDGQLLGLGIQHMYKSKILEGDRPILISVPVGYDETDVNYPALYVLDGLQNIKHVIATSEFLAETGLISPLIIVH